MDVLQKARLRLAKIEARVKKQVAALNDHSLRGRPRRNAYVGWLRDRSKLLVWRTKVALLEML